MIVYGLTMQDKPEEIPTELAAWLIDRNSRYPNIDFTIDCWDPHPSQIKEHESMARKYSRIFSLSAPFKGVLTVIFPFLKQSWNIKIVGGLDQKGQIADRSKEKSIQPLTPELRAEIAGLTLDVVKIQDNAVGIPRLENNAPLENPTDMVSLPPDFRWTSEVSMTGEELSRIFNEPGMKEEAERAIWTKNWKKLEQLKEQYSLMDDEERECPPQSFRVE